MEKFLVKVGLKLTFTPGKRMRFFIDIISLRSMKLASSRLVCMTAIEEKMSKNKPRILSDQNLKMFLPAASFHVIGYTNYIAKILQKIIDTLVFRDASMKSKFCHRANVILHTIWR